jgi:hypothetical protein
VSETRLEIALEKLADPNVVQKAVESTGVKVLDSTAVENYGGKGPYLLLTIEGEAPTALVELVKETVRLQPSPPRATFLTVKSPSGATWRIGVDDAGQLHVEGAKPASVSRSHKP